MKIPGVVYTCVLGEQLSGNVGTRSSSLQECFTASNCRQCCEFVPGSERLVRQLAKVKAS